MSSRGTRSEAPRIIREDLPPLNRLLHHNGDWYRACSYFDMIPHASGSLLGERLPKLHNQMERHLPLVVEVLACAQRLCVQDGGVLVHPWPTHWKSENYDENRRHGHVRMGSEHVKT